MSDAIWLVITHKSATCGAALSVVINFILLLFLSALPLKALGPYKWLMVTFSLFSVFYTIVESSIKPWTHENGERNVDRIAMIGVFHHFIVMFISFAIVFYCGWNTVVEMRKHQDISQTTKKVQRQLFKALVFQTAFPMVFIYIPTLLVFLAPLFNMEIGAYGNIAIVTINLYPGIDPLILLVVISDFRNVLYKTPKKILNVTNSAIQRSTVLVDRF
uniref:Seven TM Receptor n=1 Tax=Caenorhabditis tropicalis TaxID=1561998 RepID=A0A1I7UBA6_9PELO